MVDCSSHSVHIHCGRHIWGTVCTLRRQRHCYTSQNVSESEICKYYVVMSIVLVLHSSLATQSAPFLSSLRVSYLYLVTYFCILLYTLSISISILSLIPSHYISSLSVALLQSLAMKLTSPFSMTMISPSCMTPDLSLLYDP